MWRHFTKTFFILGFIYEEGCGHQQSGCVAMMSASVLPFRAQNMYCEAVDGTLGICHWPE